MPRNLPPRIQSHIIRARRMRIIGGSLLVTCLLVGTGAAFSQTQLPHQLTATLKPIASIVSGKLSQLPSALSQRIPKFDPQLPSASNQLAASATSFPQSAAEKVRNIFCRWLGCAAPDLADSSRISNNQLTNIGNQQHATLPQNVKQPAPIPQTSPSDVARSATTTSVVVSSAPASNASLASNQQITQPIIERTNTIIQTGLTEALLNEKLLALTNDLNSRMSQVAAARTYQAERTAQNIADALRIEQLTGLTAHDLTVDGVTGLTDADLPDSLTVSNYLPLSGGTLSGDLAIGGTLSASTLSVAGISSGGAVEAPYFTATSSTISSFAGGLMSLASSTIGIGTQAGGLTISGGATTTGSLVLTTSGTLMESAPRAAGWGGYKYRFNYQPIAWTNGPTGQTNYTDDVWNFGINIGTASGNRVDTSKSALFTQFESKYAQGGASDPFGSEYHLVFVAENGTTHRPISGFFNHNDDTGSMTFEADRIMLNEWGGTQRVDFAFASNNIDLHNSLKIRSTVNNASLIQQKNAAGSAYVDLLKLDASNIAAIAAPVEIAAARASSGQFVSILPSTANANDKALVISLPTITGALTGIHIAGSATGNITQTIENTDDSNTGANARLQLSAGGASGGDPYIYFLVPGVTNWSIGTDNSDSDKFKISNGSTVGNTDRLVLDTSGNVGINTTNPTYKLDVSGLGRFTGLVDAANFVATSSSATSTFAGGITGPGSFTVQSSSGRVGIGTTNPGVTLDVNGDIRTDNFLYLSRGGFGGFIYANAGAMFFNNGSSDPLALYATGGVGLGAYATGVYTPASGDLIMSGNLGIGTTSPQQALEVKGFGRFSNSVGTAGYSGVEFAKDGAVQWQLLNNTSTNSFGLWEEGSTQRLTVLEGGNVGIGDTNPGARLEITPSGTDAVYINNSSGALRYDLGLDGGDNSQMRMRNASNAISILLSAYGGTASYIDAGNFGIGTTTPGARLHVVTTSGSQARFAFDLNNYTEVNYDGLNTVGGAQLFKISGSERVRIDSSGNVGIGTTSPGTKLDVYGGTVRLSSSNSASYTDFINAVDSANAFRIQQGGFDILHSRSGGGNAGLTLGLPGSTSLVIERTNNWSYFPQGNVGIGTTTPTDKLTIQGGDIVVNEDDGGMVAARLSAGNLSGALSLYNADVTPSILLQGASGNHSYFNVALGNLGIGTTSPWAKLSITNTGTGPSFIVEDSTSPDTTPFIIDASGNVGIGTTTPATLLTISSASAPTLQIDNADTSLGLDQIVAALEFNTNDVSANGTGVAAAIKAITESSTGSDQGLGFFTKRGQNSIPLTEYMRITSTGNVGIGTTSPTALLSVAGSGGELAKFDTTSASGGYLSLSNSGTNVGYFGTAAQLASGSGLTASDFAARANNNLLFVSNAGSSAKYMILTNSGNLGIGTTTPYSKLQTLGTASNPSLTALSTSIASFTNGSNNLDLAIGQMSASPYTSWIQARDRVTNGNAYPLALNPLGGNVGIGTTTPGAKLTLQRDSEPSGTVVHGNTSLFLDANGSHYIQLGAPTNSVVGFLFGDSGNNQIGAITYNNATDALTFHANPGLVVTQNSIGFGIGTTSPAATLSVAGNGYFTGGLGVGLVNTTAGTLQTSGAATVGGLLWANKATADQARFSGWSPIGTATAAAGSITIGQGGYSGLNIFTVSDGNTFAYFDNIYDNANSATIFRARSSGTPVTQLTLSGAGAVRFNAYGAGTLSTDGSGNITASSDERLKNIQGDFAAGLTQLEQLSPILYTWKPETGFDASTTYAGFSAQNVQQAIPEAVGQGKDGYLTLQDRPLIAALVNAVKEIASIGGAFKANLIAWLADASNGIQDLFAKNLYAENIEAKRGTFDELCVKDDVGVPVCVTGIQLRSLLSGSVLGATAENDNDPPADAEPVADEPMDEPTDTIDTPASSTPPASDEPPAEQTAELVPDITEPANDNSPPTEASATGTE